MPMEDWFVTIPAAYFQDFQIQRVCLANLYNAINDGGKIVQ